MATGDTDVSVVTAPRLFGQAGIAAGPQPTPQQQQFEQPLQLRLQHLQQRSLPPARQHNMPAVDQMLVSGGFRPFDQMPNAVVEALPGVLLATISR